MAPRKAEKTDPLAALGGKLLNDMRGSRADLLPRPKSVDTRGRMITADARDAAEIRTKTRDALAEIDITLAEDDLQAVVRDIDKMHEQANKAMGAFLEVGRALLRVQAAVGSGGYRRLFQAGLMPFPESTASKMRVVAAAVAEGKLPGDRLPQTLDPAYFAAKLPAAQLEELLDKGVIRRDASRRQIIAASAPPKPVADPLPAAERRKLERRREELREELAAMRAEIAAIQADLREVEARLAAG